MHIIIIYSAALFNHSLAEFSQGNEKKWCNFAKNRTIFTNQTAAGLTACSVLCSKTSRLR